MCQPRDSGVPNCASLPGQLLAAPVMDVHLLEFTEVSQITRYLRCSRVGTRHLVRGACHAGLCLRRGDSVIPLQSLRYCDTLILVAKDHVYKRFGIIRSGKIVRHYAIVQKQCLISAVLDLLGTGIRYVQSVLLVSVIGRINKLQSGPHSVALGKYPAAGTCNRHFGRYFLAATIEPRHWGTRGSLHHRQEWSRTGQASHAVLGQTVGNNCRTGAVPSGADWYCGVAREKD